MTVIARVTYMYRFMDSNDSLICWQVHDWLGELLWEGGMDCEIYRMKGVFNIQGSDNMYMLQVAFHINTCNSSVRAATLGTILYTVVNELKSL